MVKIISQTNVLKIKNLKISQILEKVVKIKSYSLNLQKFYNYTNII